MKRSDVVRTMQSWIGVREPNHQFILDIYNDHLPLARGYTVKNRDAWCATCASAALIVNGWTGPTECGCEEWINRLNEVGMYNEDDSYVPQAGDIIFYDWDDNGYGDCTGHADHVGIVEQCNDNIITVIEGNNNNMVRRRNIAVNSRYIRGYGLPDYEDEAAALPVQQIEPVQVNEGEAAVYRLYNPSTGEHFFTVSIEEGNTLVRGGWNYEGVAWVAPVNSSIGVIRLINPNSGFHMYSASAVERDALVSVGWQAEGIAFYSDDNQATPVYRLYNPNSQDHMFTANIDEYYCLIQNGWNNEGIDFYAKRKF